MSAPLMISPIAVLVAVVQGLHLQALIGLALLAAAPLAGFASFMAISGNRRPPAILVGFSLFVVAYVLIGAGAWLVRFG